MITCKLELHVSLIGQSQTFLVSQKYGHTKSLLVKATEKQQCFQRWQNQRDPDDRDYLFWLSEIKHLPEWCLTLIRYSSSLWKSLVFFWKCIRLAFKTWAYWSLERMIIRTVETGKDSWVFPVVQYVDVSLTWMKKIKSYFKYFCSFHFYARLISILL